VEGVETISLDREIEPAPVKVPPPPFVSEIEVPVDPPTITELKPDKTPAAPNVSNKKK
jgi:hypothetical protein